MTHPAFGTGPLVRIEFGIEKLATTMADRAENMRRTNGAIRAAHTVIAKDLQERIAFALEESVESRGREQKTEDVFDGALPRALRSEKNRNVTVQGFSVGYLGTMPEVDPYYRGLEYGSSKFVGRFLRGAFKNRAGKWQRPVEGGLDYKFVQLAAHIPKGSRQLRGSGLNKRAPKKAYPGVLIRHPIQPYHYFQRGLRSATTTGLFSGEEAIAVYVATFERLGFDAAADVFRLALHGGSSRSIGLKNAPSE